MYINHNGILSDGEHCISISNRAFQYGDALFETIKWRNGKALFIDDHMGRLMQSMNLLQMELPDFFSTSFFTTQIEQLTQLNNCSESARIRLQVFREGDGFYHPKSNKVSFVISATPLENIYYNLNEKPLNIGVYIDNKKVKSKLSSIKSSNALLYILAALYADKNKFDDCLLLNENGNVTEAISSSVFILNGDQLITPPLKDGGVDGIMRKQLIKYATAFKYSFSEKSLTVAEVLNAEEIILTNTIQGIRTVKKNHDYEIVKQFIKKINE